MHVPERLLILSCSERKRSSPDKLPAIQRYDGPAFRVLRKYLSINSPEDHLDVFVLSAEFGLIPARRKIPLYDRRITSKRAEELNPATLRRLGRISKGKGYSNLLLNVGSDYMVALRDFEDTMPPDVRIEVAQGSQGRRLSTLYDWLHGVPPSSHSGKHRGRVVFRGIEIDKSARDVIAVAREALKEQHGKPDNYQSWYVLVDSRPVSPKWVISELTGLSVNSFVTGEARRVLAQLGVEVKRV